MSARPISGSEDADRARARAAGWRRADLDWERLTEDGVAAFAAGDIARARALLGRAGLIARWRFGRHDPRRAAALANLAALDRLAGRQGRAARRYARARAIWEGVPAQVAALEPAPRPRSSLFHMRMELRHRDTYLDNLRKRLAGFAAETGEALAALEAGRPSPHRLAGRWRAEKPPVFDPVRQFLAAALLIAEPPAQG